MGSTTPSSLSIAADLSSSSQDLPSESTCSTPPNLPQGRIEPCPEQRQPNAPQMRVEEMCEWIECTSDEHRIFKTSSWRSSVRFNLTANAGFEKVPTRAWTSQKRKQHAWRLSDVSVRRGTLPTERRAKPQHGSSGTTGPSEAETPAARRAGRKKRGGGGVSPPRRADQQPCRIAGLGCRDLAETPASPGASPDAAAILEAMQSQDLPLCEESEISRGPMPHPVRGRSMAFAARTIASRRPRRNPATATGHRSVFWITCIKAERWLVANGIR